MPVTDTRDESDAAAAPSTKNTTEPPPISSPKFESNNCDVSALRSGRSPCSVMNATVTAFTDSPISVHVLFPEEKRTMTCGYGQ